MGRRAAVAVYRVAFGALALAAIATQLADLAGKGALNPVNYFSYFTIQSNLIATAVFLVGAARWRAERSPQLDVVRGGAVVYMLVTGVVFSALLSGTNVDTAIPWVNSVVHQVMPIVVALDWLVDPPLSRLSIRQGFLWLSYPAAWIVYILIRGALVHLYPYPFLNPNNGGYGSVAAYCAAILVLMTGVCIVVVVVGNAMSRRVHVTQAVAAP